MYSYQQWIIDFLNALGAPLSDANINFMEAWIQKESGSYPITNGFNPLNTTQKGPPGTWYGGSQGNIAFYPSYASGIQATVQTIQNGYYPDILSGLMGGTANTNTYYPGLNTWGTHQLSGVSPNQTSMQQTSSGGGSNSGSWLNGIPVLGPLLSLGQALTFNPQQIGSNILVSAFAVLLILIGALWIIFGNQDTKKVFIAKATDALV